MILLPMFRSVASVENVSNVPNGQDEKGTNVIRHGTNVTERRETSNKSKFEQNMKYFVIRFVPSTT